MSKKKAAVAAAPVLEATVSQTTLEGTPERAVKFLRGVGTVPAIRAALASRGYDAEEHARGWSLLHAASGYEQSGRDAFATTTDTTVHNAIASLDAWDEDGFRTVRAALQTKYPSQYATLTSGIGPVTGAAAVIGVKTLLSRIDALGKSHNADDKAAAKAVEKRGITREVVASLRSLIGIAEKGAAPATPGPDAYALAADAAGHQAALIELRAWFQEWSEMAHVAIKRRDRLIRLGLAVRKSPSRPTAADPPNGSASTSLTVDPSKDRPSGVADRKQA